MCKWCYTEILITVNHHYPVEAHCNGTETVSICPNCHRIAHAGIIINAIATRDEDEYQKEYDQSIIRAIKSLFPKLYEQGEFYNPFSRVLILNPYWKVKPHDE